MKLDYIVKDSNSSSINLTFRTLKSRAKLEIKAVTLISVLCKFLIICKITEDPVDSGSYVNDIVM